MKFSTPTKHTNDLGVFTVKSGAIRFSDPCYGNDTWCKGSMPAVNGQYQAQIGFFRDPYDEAYLLETLKRIKLGIDILTAIDHVEYEKYKRIKKHLRQADYRFNKGNDVLYPDIPFDDDLKPILQTLEKHVTETVGSVKSEWEEYGKWIKSEIDDIVTHVLSEKYHHNLDTSKEHFGHHMAMEQMNTRVPDDTKNEDFEAVHFSLHRPITVKYMGLALESRQKSFDEGKPLRPHYLRIRHESIPEYTPIESEDWIYNESFDVGVDSGQAGFFDEEWFTQYGKEYSDNDRSEAWEKTYDMLCALSSNGDSYRNADNPKKESGGTFEFGCNSYTAHGDGSAPLFYRTNEKGEVIEAIYAYDCEDEEEE